MFELIAAGLTGGVVGGSLAGLLALGRAGRRIDDLGDFARNTGVRVIDLEEQARGFSEALDQQEAFVTREELQAIFANMAVHEEHQRMQAQMAQAQQAQQAELQRLRMMAMQQPAPVFRNEAAAGAFQAEAGGRPAPPNPAEINAQLQQQLASLNQRLQQVTSQRMPQG